MTERFYPFQVNSTSVHSSSQSDRLLQRCNENVIAHILKSRARDIEGSYMIDLGLEKIWEVLDLVVSFRAIKRTCQSDDSVLIGRYGVSFRSCC